MSATWAVSVLDKMVKLNDKLRIVTKGYFVYDGRLVYIGENIKDGQTILTVKSKIGTHEIFEQDIVKIEIV